MEQITIAVIMTVFNRKNITLKCLASIHHKYIMSKFDVDVDIYLTDDNSPDGTYETILEEYPKVHVYKTDGTLFWGRGMLYSWQKAVEHGGYDGFLWMNDDNELFDDAIEEMIICADNTDWKSIVCGCFMNSKGNFTYGGFDINKKKIIPNGELQEIHYMNGNLVLIPQNVVNLIGILDPHFHHIGGDYDYGLTAREHGIKVYSTTKYIGRSERNPKGDSRGRIKGHSFVQRIYDLYKCPFIDNPPQIWYAKRKHGKNIFYCIAFMIKMHTLVWLPDSIYYKIKKLYGKKN